MGVRLYLSSYGLGNRPKLFASLLDSDAKGFVIMNATEGGDAHRRQQALLTQVEGLARIGLHADGLDLRDWHPDSLERGLAGAAFFWVHGGNVFTLRMAMLQSGFDQYLTNGLHADRFAYAGFSAGACVLAPGLSGLELCDPKSDCEAIYGRVIEEGLGILDRPFVPHLRSKDHHEAETMQAVAEHYASLGSDFWGLTDGQALVVNGGPPTVV